MLAFRQKFFLYFLKNQKEFFAQCRIYSIEHWGGDEDRGTQLQGTDAAGIAGHH